MNTTAIMHRYCAFGLSIHSELPLPELVRPDSAASEAADVRIRLADLSRDWSTLPDQRHLQVRGKDVFYLIPGAAIYRVRDGCEIAVSPFEDADPGLVRLYVLGSCMGALLLQRRMLPLHGSALAIDGKAYVIVGPSGAGKSTLAAALAARGQRLISDDISPIRWQADEALPSVVPSYPQQKLWRQSLQQLGMDESALQSLHAESDKFAVPAHTAFSNRAVPLAGIIELVRRPAGGRACMQVVGGLDKFPVMTAHTYRNYLISALQLQQWHFSVIARMCGMVPVYRLIRPEGRFTAGELASLLLRTVSDGEEEMDAL